MRFTTITKNNIPRAKKTAYKVLSQLDEFMRMDCEAVEVSFLKDEYKSIDSAYTTIAKSIQRSGHPIKIVMRGEHLYLIRKDM